MKSVIDYRDDPLVKGPCAAIAYARQTNDKRPALDYIENLEKEDWAKLAKSFTKMAQVGKIWDTERFRKVCGKIWEFKIHPKVRVLCFQSGKTWFLTNGFDKETGNTPRKEIERAEQIMREHIARFET